MQAMSEGAALPLTIRFIRGVGSAAPGSSAAAARPILDAWNVSTAADIAEIDWSSQAYMPAPHTPAMEEDFSSAALDLTYLRRIGASVRTAATLGLDNHPALYAFSLGLQATPALLIIAACLLAFGVPYAFHSVGAVLLICAMGMLLLAIGKKSGTLAAAVRCIVLLLAWPLIFVLSLLATRPWARLVGWGVTLGVPVYLFATIEMGSSLSAAGIPMYHDTFKPLLIVVVSGVVLRVTSWLLGLLYARLLALLSPLIKILADVALYLGDTEYRTQLRAHVSASIRHAMPGRHVVIAAHSLGTVVSVDVLRNLPRTEGQVTLITAGSPLLRLFHRFFRDHYPRPAQILTELRARHASFSWLNIYRPKDPVGASLQLPPGCDFSTEQKELGWRKAHIDYWPDRVVNRLVHDHIRKLAGLVAPGDPARTSAFLKDRSPDRAPPLWHFTCGVLYFCLAALMVRGVWTVVGEPVWSAWSTFNRLQEQRHMGTGTLYAHIEWQLTGGEILVNTPLTRYHLGFKPPGSGEARHKIQDPYTNDLNRLCELFVRDELAYETEPYSGRRAATVQVPIVYSPQHPDAFMLAPFARQSIPWWRVAIAAVLLVTVVLPSLLLIGLLQERFLEEPLAAWIGVAPRKDPDAKESPDGFELFWMGSAIFAPAMLVGIAWAFLQLPMPMGDCENWTRSEREAQAALTGRDPPNGSARQSGQPGKVQ